MNNNNRITPTLRASTIKTKRNMATFINKKSKLSTYTFDPIDPTTITLNKPMKHVTLTQMKEVTVNKIGAKSQQI